MTDFNTYIVEFKNGGIINIDTRGEFYRGGCPTCEIGSERINYITVETTNYIIKTILAKEYSFAISKDYDNYYEEDMATGIDVQTLLDILDIENTDQITEQEFVKYFTNAIVDTTDCVDIRVTRKELTSNFYYYDEDFLK